VVALILMLVRADGQRLAALGLARKGALRELVAATWMSAGAFAVQIAIAIPLQIVSSLAGLAGNEAEQRTEAVSTIASQGSPGEVVLGLVVAAAFEEIAFRAFLTPRLRAITGSWVAGILIANAAFGLGHVYEGTLAVVQTAMLGVYFGVMTLARRAVLAPILAHATFNAIMLAIARVLMHARVLEQLKDALHG
jgi:membrane protease YdiL (CAAX protease family)